MANCQKCGADIPIGAARCEYCGAVVDLPKESPSAGTKVERGTVPGAGTPCFKRVSVGMMVVFALITTGLYLSAWFFVRRGQFAGLSPKAKNARHLFGGLLGVHIFYLLAWLGYLGSPDAELLSTVELLWWGFMGVMFYSAFVARAALAEFSEARGAKFAGSVLWALLLNAFYLQSQINGMIDARLLSASS